MAYFADRIPDLRMSDVDELIRETAMDDSSGQRLMDYIKRKRGGARTRLYDGSDNPINFRLEHLQPVPVPQTSAAVTRETAVVRSPEAAARSCVVVLESPTQGQSAENRIASFVSPARPTIHSPVVRSSRFVTSLSTRQSGGLGTNVKLTGASDNTAKILQKKALLQQYKRSNQLKCEVIRSANHPAASTPISGESTQQSKDNFLSLRETISPIADDEVDSTPHGPSRSSGARSRILTPVPATQPPPPTPHAGPGTGLDEGNRENTPPRGENQRPLVIPETPSPVRRSPRNPGTPLCALSASYRPVARDLTFQNEGNYRPEVQKLPVSNGTPQVPTPTRRSILKNYREGLSASPRNRVSFSEKLTSVREITPQRNAPPDDVTSDESEDDAMNVSMTRLSVGNILDKPIETRASNRDGMNGVDQSRRQFGKARSYAFDESSDEEVPNTNAPTLNANDAAQVDPVRHDHSKKTKPDRTNGNVVNMIVDDWTESTPMEMNESDKGETIVDEVAQQTINSSELITNIDTPRTVMMDILEPPSFFCDDRSSGPPEQAALEHETADRASGLDRSDPTRKRQINEVLDRESMARSNICKLPSGRIVSATSPHDHVPADMLQAADMIHSKMGSDVHEASERRTTFVLPSKRRSKPKVHQEAEQYFATIEKTCTQERPKNRQPNSFRKLFSQEFSQEKDRMEQNTSPQPLPPTQETSVDPPSEQVASQLKSLSIVVKRLSAGTLKAATEPESLGDVGCRNQMDAGSSNGSDDDVPSLEKHNVERSEKADLPKRNDDDAPRKPAGSKSSKRQKKADKPKAPPAQKKTAREKKQSPTSPSTADPASGDQMVQKYLKNVSNEIRQHIDSEADGLRRSHRSKRVPKEVLDMYKGVPMYVMPSVKDIMKYRGDRLQQKNKKPTKNVPGKKEKNQDEKQEKMVRSEQQAEEGRFDADGFRIPANPTEGGAGSSVAKQTKKKKQSARSKKDTSTMTSPVVRIDHSTDSGISSGALTNEDVTQDSDVSSSKRPKMTSKPSSKPAEVATDAPSTSSVSSATAPPEDIVTEKRKAFEWMMVLMENRQIRPEAMPMIEVQGFTHLSLEHLYFERRNNIEYSFYVYSNGENFGFLRFLPHAEKKMTRTRGYLLKFLVLSGTLKFIINENELNVAGGDFLMLPINPLKIIKLQKCVNQVGLELD
uniref:Mif2/CENP-C cupin domain-containing protein n=1 Tax=Anopheles dirus TaxID=7168 RepID=A0A182NRM5_9DIPT